MIHSFPVESCSGLAISEELKHPLESLVFFSFAYAQGNHAWWIEEKIINFESLKKNMFHHCWFSKLLPCAWTTNWRSLALLHHCCAALMLLLPLLCSRQVAWLIGRIFSWERENRWEGEREKQMRTNGGRGWERVDQMALSFWLTLTTGPSFLGPHVSS